MHHDEGPQVALRVLHWAGYGGDAEWAMEGLTKFREWLADEAIPAGGLGPNEADRLWRRHIADSLAFLPELGRSREILDAGCGVGLPGIPLAIILPRARFVLVDNAGRRCRLARRAMRVLGLRNVDVVQADINSFEGSADTLITRAVVSPEKVLTMARAILPHGELAIAAGSHGVSLPTPVASARILHVPRDVLGHGAWLLVFPLGDNP